LYITPHYALPSFKDAVLHYSMLFGVLPASATSTPLPDWSLSLEFQFYLLYPLLFLFVRSRLLLVCGIAACAAYVSPALFGFYLQPGKLAHFDQPSFLPYKLNLFLVGVLINTWLKHLHLPTSGNQQSSQHDRYSQAMLIVAMVVCLAVSGFLTTLGVALILYLIVRPQSQLSIWLSAPLPRFYGEISFTIYLVHRPLLLMIAGMLTANRHFVAQSGAIRIVIVSVLLLLLTTLVSWLLNIVVERPGNQLARRLTSKPSTALPVSGHRGVEGLSTSEK
jgi:peptidoglycan/LPS O-acetylase OafA/YrhL